MSCHKRPLSIVWESVDQTEAFWSKYQRSGWGGDKDLKRVANSINPAFSASQKFAELNRILSDACTRQDFVVLVNKRRQFHMHFDSQIESSPDSHGLDHFLFMTRTIRRRSLLVFWGAMKQISPALQEIPLVDCTSIRKFIKNPHNAPYFSPIRWLGCELLGPPSLLFFPRELTYLKNLTHLEAENCGFLFLPNKVYRCFKRLEYLNLKYNQLSSWKLSSKEFPHLKNLDLSENQIKNFSIDRAGNCLKRIGLGRNPVLSLKIQGIEIQP